MPESNPDISVIIVNYNTKDFLLQSLKSIQNSNLGDLLIEIIVVDNNSTDDSVNFLKPLFPNVEFIKSDINLGFGKGNNLGARYASSKYYLFLNPDTIIEDDTISVMYHYMESNKEVGIAGCKVLNSDGTFQLACRRGFPTPWVSFTKLFGFQTLFPKSRLFAKYNLTYLPVNETYKVDSVIGAFMFIRHVTWMDINGFDEDFFMYGEDLDLCYRAKQKGWDTAYVHATSIIHHKGISTRRSNINELFHFYNAMEIFARKHFASSELFLVFLKSGIFIRSLLAKLNSSKKEILTIIYDILAICFALMLGTLIRFNGFLNFPDYAYPTVFIIVPLVMIFSMVLSGEYFEKKHTIRKMMFGLLLTFFFLSSLTYFFKNFAFSRGVVLMTIGFTFIFGTVLRFIYYFFDKIINKRLIKRIAIVGINENSVSIFNQLKESESSDTSMIGFIVSQNTIAHQEFKVLGNIEYLDKIIEDNKLNEIIFADNQMTSGEIFSSIERFSSSGVKFHIANEFDDIITARIINDITGKEPDLPVYNYSKLKLRILKRNIDIIVSILTLTFGLPVVFLFSKHPKKIILKIWMVFIGKFALVGVNKTDNQKYNAKEGLFGLAKISTTDNITDKAIDKLNEYYLKNYSLSLDFDIILKTIIRRFRGNKVRS